MKSSSWSSSKKLKKKKNSNSDDGKVFQLKQPRVGYAQHERKSENFDIAKENTKTFLFVSILKLWIEFMKSNKKQFLEREW